MAAHAYIGTSGWNYDGWKDDFYAGVPRRQWLAHSAARFSALEINATFYRLQRRETLAKWADAVPDRFRFALKANRYLTHNRKLKAAAESLALEKERADALGEKLAAVLWQLPANFKKNSDRLGQFLAALGQWPEARHTIEFRHPSWFDAEIAELLGAHGVAVCQSDAADWPLWDAVTAPMVYVRLHGHTRTYASAYGDASLDRWAEAVSAWLAEGRDVHVYFDNDAEGAAPHDALRLLERVKGEGH